MRPIFKAATTEQIAKRPKYSPVIKGDEYLAAGLIFAPYIPVYATPSFIVEDLIKGRIRSYNKVTKQFYYINE